MISIVWQRRLTASSIILAPSLLLILLMAVHIIPGWPQPTLVYSIPPPVPNADRVPLQLSSDPYTNSSSQHQTEVEPDTYAYGLTLVTAYQAGRFSDGGSSNIGWATSTDGGSTWENGFLPGTTKFANGPYTRVSDPSVSYDAAHHTWMISSIAVVGSGATLASPAVIVSLSTDGGITWSNPVKVVKGGSTYFDTDWIVCDNTATSHFYGHCYVEWDNDDKGGLILMSTSIDGGHSWGAPLTTADQAHGLGGQPLVQPNGTVIVPISGYNVSRMYAFISSDGGKSWSSTVTVAHINGSALPSAEIDASGKVYLVWTDCHFEKVCDTSAKPHQDDLVMSTSTDGITWSPVQLIPIDPVGSGIDHLVPGLGVDKSTSGSSAHLALAFYYHPVNCDKHCGFYVGFVASRDGGAHWTKKIALAGPIDLSWLPRGRNKVGDYISTSFSDELAFPVFSIASAPSDGHLNEAMYTVTGGLIV